MTVKLQDGTAISTNSVSIQQEQDEAIAKAKKAKQRRCIGTQDDIELIGEILTVETYKPPKHIRKWAIAALVQGHKVVYSNHCWRCDCATWIYQRRKLQDRIWCQHIIRLDSIIRIHTLLTSIQQLNPASTEKISLEALLAIQHPDIRLLPNEMED